MRFLLLFLAVFIFATPVLALEVPPLEGRINDRAGILSAETKKQLTETLAAFEKKSSHQIAVLLIPSLEGESLEDYSIRVASAWKIGQKGVDNGILLLIARDDHKMRIEVGYGLEGSLTDARSSEIIRNDIAPHFKQNDFDGGVTAGLQSIMAAVESSPLSEPRKTDELKTTLGGKIFLVIVFGIISYFTLRLSGWFGWTVSVFLVPVWFVILVAAMGGLGIGIFSLYLLGFIPARLWFAKHHPLAVWSGGSGGSSSRSFWMSSSSSSDSSSSSSDDDSFSGGGGSFGGGGASGDW